MQSDLTPADLATAYSDFLDEAIRLRSIYSDRISLLIGLETDYITPIDLDGTARLLERRPDIDYVVGSVHHVNGVSIDFDRPTWVRAVRTVVEGSTSSTMTVSPSSGTVSLPPVIDADVAPPMQDSRQFLSAYFDAQYDMLQAHQPEVVGHFDLCLLWTPHVSLKDDRLLGVWEKVVRNVEYVVGYGGLFEANAAAIRKGWKTSYPNPDVLQVSAVSHMRDIAQG
jgi:histidinol-phosphatase (PHP family)